MRVRRIVPEATLRLVGTGPLRQDMMRRARELGLAGAISFDGFVQPRHLAAIYRRAQVFVFPSLRDTFAQVLAEAATTGLPIVCSPFAGAVGEFAVDGSNALVRDPRDAEAFAGAAIDLLTSSDLRRRMGAASIRLSHRRGVASVAKRTAMLLSELAVRGDRVSVYSGSGGVNEPQFLDRD